MAERVENIRGVWVRRGNARLELGRFSRAITEYRELRIPEGSTVLDIGAHIGGTSFGFLAMGAGKVVSVEPDPISFEALQKNLAGLRVVPIHGAIVPESHTEEVVSLKINDEFSDLDTIMDPSSWSSDLAYHSVDVPALHLGDLIEEFKPTVLKVSVEGAEHEIELLKDLPTSITALAIQINAKDLEMLMKDLMLQQALMKSGWEPIRKPSRTVSSSGIYIRGE